MRAEDALQLAKIYTKKTLAGSGALKGEKGDPGKDGKSAYDFAKDGGYTGTEAEFAEKLASENGSATYDADTKTLNICTNANEQAVYLDGNEVAY